MKICRTCERSDTEVKFTKRTDTGKFYSNCNLCRSKANRKLTTEERRNNNYKAMYGIDLETYQNMLEEQMGLCAICGIHESKLDRKLSVDHCHTSGKVRGLLCQRCNMGLGLLTESTHVLRKAIEYLDNNI